MGMDIEVWVETRSKSSYATWQSYDFSIGWLRDKGLCSGLSVHFHTHPNGPWQIDKAFLSQRVRDRYNQCTELGSCSWAVVLGVDTLSELEAESWGNSHLGSLTQLLGDLTSDTLEARIIMMANN